MRASIGTVPLCTASTYGYASAVEGKTHREPADALHDAYLRAIARSALRAAEERARKRSLAIARLRESLIAQPRPEPAR